MAATEKLEFQSAMHDFKAMFPHMENRIIEEVLRRNNGMVDQTIDDLLAITCVENDPEPTPTTPSSSSAAYTPAPHQQIPYHPPQQTPYQQQIPPPQSPYTITQARVVAAPPAAAASRYPGPYPTLSAHLPPGDLTLTPRSRQPAHQKYGQVPVSFLGCSFPIPFTQPLPDRFLRLNEPRISGNSSQQLMSQVAEDRDFALLLYNQEFLEQARNNSEFMRTLQQDSQLQERDEVPSSSNGTPVASRPADESSIVARLSQTGRETRTKLLKIAKKLNFKKTSKSRQPLLFEDNRTDNDDEEAREPLFQDDSENEIIYTDFGDEDEVLKTLPGRATLNNFEVERMKAREAMADRLRSGAPPVPPPPRPTSSSTFYTGTLGSTGNTLDRPTPEGSLINLSDPIYEEQESIYAALDDDDTVSNTISEASIPGGPDARAIHSQTLSSSYLIPIRTVTDTTEEEVYDNLVGRNENSLIRF